MSIAIHLVSVTPRGQHAAHAVVVNGWVLESASAGAIRLEVADGLAQIRLTVCRPREADSISAAREAAFRLGDTTTAGSTQLDVQRCLERLEGQDRAAAVTLTSAGQGSIGSRGVPTYLYQAGHMARVDPVVEGGSEARVRPVALTPDRRLVLSTVALEELWVPVELRWPEAQVSDTRRWLSTLAALVSEQVADPLCLVGVQAERELPSDGGAGSALQFPTQP